MPPRKFHRRSNSDIPNSIPPRPLERGESPDWSNHTPPFVKKESGEDMDDLFSAYMNLENIDALNSSEADDNNSKNGESSRASGTKTNGSDDTEGESSSVNYESGGDRNNSLKRRAGGEGDIAPTTRHYRSVSVDSCFMEKMSFGEDSLKPPPTNSVDGGIEFKSGEFNAAEMKKIMANDKLAEMAVSDPKRVKRYNPLSKFNRRVRTFMQFYNLFFFSGYWRTVSLQRGQRRGRCGTFWNWNTKCRLFRPRLLHCLLSSRFCRCLISLLPML